MAAGAGVTEQTFHSVFPTVAECYRATFDEGLAQVSQTVERAAGRAGRWFDRVRAGVVGLLGFLDDEPQWARLLLGEPPLAGVLGLERGQRLVGVLTCLLDDPRAEACAQAQPRSALTAELVAGGVFCVIRARAEARRREPLVELAPSLMVFIAAQYGDPSMAYAQARTDERARAVSRAGELPIRVTQRTTLVLRAIARAPYSNNREVAQAAGLVDEGQTSKLLARLERKGVIENVGVGAARGEPNAWLLTASGRRAVELLSSRARAGAVRPGGAA